MKTRLLKKVRNRVKMYERGGFYHVDTLDFKYTCLNKRQALIYYRIEVLLVAEMFAGVRIKKIITQIQRKVLKSLCV